MSACDTQGWNQSPGDPGAQPGCHMCTIRSMSSGEHGGSQQHTIALSPPSMGGGLLHVDMFANNKRGIAYRDRNQRSETVVDHKREPHQQPRLLPSCTN
jgi:hypothetical protein